jgi:hypothetical protein
MDGPRLRDHGLALISRINRWLISGAIAATGALAFLAANAFHGHTAHAATTTPSSTSSSSNEAQPVAPPSDDNSAGDGLSSPSSAPSPVPQPAPVPQGPVSGGS